MENLLNLFFPDKCLFCYKVGSLFCRNCLEHCEPLKNNRYFLTEDPKGLSLEVFSCFIYDDIVRQCIKKAKYGARRFAALKTLSRLGAAYTYNLGVRYQGYVAVPIPLNIKKARVRGFNQAEIIAKITGQKFGIKTDCTLLYRSKDTDVQYNFDRKQRFLNLKGVFRGNPGKVRGKRVLLVDDICTSGATLLEAAKTIKGCGAAEVKGYTLSRKPLIR
jgi:competence protein ComFC